MARKLMSIALSLMATFQAFLYIPAMSTTDVITANVNFTFKTETDQIGHILTFTTNDRLYQTYQATYFGNMKIGDGLSLTGGSNSVVVAVVDTGVDLNHPDLAGKILASGYNFVAGNSDVSDDNGHGTLVAGIIAANVNNNLGVTGATENCMILPVKVMDEHGNGSETNIAAGIKYAADHGANIINLSLGLKSSSNAIQEAVDYANSKGVIMVAGTGNDGADSLYYPAACTNVIAVGSVDGSGKLATYSNFGGQVSLVAYGTNIASTYVSNGKHVYATSTGTSMACPFVSSLAALILSENNKLTPAEVLSVMENTAQHVGDKEWNDHYGYGIINFEAALNKVLSGNNDSSNNTPAPEDTHTNIDLVSAPSKTAEQTSAAA